MPTLILNARNDPFIPAHSLPDSRKSGPACCSSNPKTAGMPGSPQRPFPGNLDWLPARLLPFFSQPR